MKKLILLSAVLCSLTTAYAGEWTFQDIQPDIQYYIYNLGQEEYLNDDNTLTPYASSLWMVNADGSIVSGTGRYISITESHVDTKVGLITTAREYTFHASSASTDSIAMSELQALPADDPQYYVLGNLIEDSWSRGVISAKTESHVHYFTVDSSGTLCADSTTVDTADGQWIFVSRTDYENAATARANALARLQATIEGAEYALDNTITSTAARASLRTAITTAKAIYSTATSALLGKTIKYDKIVSTADDLQSSIDLASGLSDYYVASMQAIGYAERIGGGAALLAITKTATVALEASMTTNAMNAAITAMRVAILGYVRSLDAIDEDTELTALVANSSFDTGDLSGWHTTSGEFDAGTAAAQADDVVANVEGRYFLNNNTTTSGITGIVAQATGQFILQPVVGLPAGEYQASALMAVDKGRLSTNSAHISAIVAPSSMFAGVDSITVEVVMSKIGDFIRDGQLKSGAVKTDTSDILEEATVEFSINEGDVLVLGLNGGLIPVTGSVPYKADAVRLLYLRALDNPAGMSAIPASDDSTPTEVYDLYGRRVTDGYRGITITRGHKTLHR